MSISSTGLSDEEKRGRNSTRAAYSVAEAAQRLGVSEASIWRALRRGELTARKLGGRTLIPASQVDGFGAAACAVHGPA
jgi:excisionase family DNA binding protein